jgi:hypothetical protein
MRLGMNSRREIFEVRYWHCQRTGKKDKEKILDETAGTTGLNRNHLIHALASCGKKRAGQAAKGKSGSDTESGSWGKALAGDFFDGCDWKRGNRPCITERLWTS